MSAVVSIGRGRHRADGQVSEKGNSESDRAEKPELPRPSRRTVVAAIVLTLVVVGGLLAAGLAGIRAYSMTTASMGTTAPVGTLVVTEPLHATAHVGEVLAFHPPGQPAATFVHRVVAVEHQGGGTQYATRGDLSGTNDPWLVTPAQVLGQRLFTVPAIGWLLRLLPWLVAGTLSVVVLCLAFPTRVRSGLRVFGLSAVGIVAVWHFRPLTSFEFISSGPTGNGGGKAYLVGTGVLPMTLRALHSPVGHTVVRPGEVGTIRTSHLTPQHGMPILASVHLTGWWWLVIIVWLLPLATAFRYRRQVVDESPVLLAGGPTAPLGGAPTWRHEDTAVQPPTWASADDAAGARQPTWGSPPGD